MKVSFDAAKTKSISCTVNFVASDKLSTYNLPFLHDVHAKKGEAAIFRVDPTPIVVVGMGESSKVCAEDLRNAAGLAVRLIEHEEWLSVKIILPKFLAKDSEAAAIVQGMILGSYRFDRYKAEPKTAGLAELLFDEKEKAVEHAVHKAVVLAKATMMARDLSNEPPNVLRPSVLAEFVVEHFQESPAKVTVFAEDELVKHQMTGLLTVGKGSTHRPRFIEIRYESDPEKPLIALVGKGLTFDSGGISLKSGRDISDMRMDMAGSAAVIGAIDALVQLRVPCNVVGLIAAAENLPDAGSMLPGELIQYPNGVTVQVANTDAEGRLVLADALIYAQQLQATHVVDIATLTGAAAQALGFRYAAVFGHDDVVHDLQKAGDITGDYVWPFPMPLEYEEKLKSVYADISNIGKGSGGAITAALFLRRFVGETQAWAHVDMAGPMEAESTEGYRPAGATGYGVRILAQYVLDQNA